MVNNKLIYLQARNQYRSTPCIIWSIVSCSWCRQIRIGHIFMYLCISIRSVWVLYPPTAKYFLWVNYYNYVSWSWLQIFHLLFEGFILLTIHAIEMSTDWLHCILKLVIHSIHETTSSVTINSSNVDWYRWICNTCDDQ